MRPFAMRPKILVLAFAIATLTLALLATAAFADEQRKAKATLTGYEETPSTLSSPGRGEFRATIDDRNREISYSLTIGGLPTNILFAHVHFGQRATSGGVSAFLCGGGSKPAPCPANGTVQGIIKPEDVVGPTGQGIAPGEWDELVAAMRAGYTYANVHTSAFPGGEIRGQINDKNNDRIDRGDQEDD
jgi:CHRD domain-containing protein